MSEEDRTVQYGYGEIHYRAQHGEGLSWETVQLGKRLVQLRLKDRRHAALDAILIEHGLLEAANALEQAQAGLCRGLGATVADVNRIRGNTTSAGDWLQALISDYLLWDRACKDKHHSPMMCREVIIEGYSLNQCDEKNRMQHGTAKKNMVACLEIFAKMRK
jgi:hypothetical protein